ncbi:MAG: BREX-2 system adenine-specific DNA-methyltransferase PglX [Pseudonocardiaceae bacterium]
MAASGVDLAELVKDLRRQVIALEADLRSRSDEVDEFAAALQSEYEQAYEAGRTAATHGAWRDTRVTQAAAAWVLATAFVRFCEDNGLIEWPFIAGPGERLADAEERHDAFREHPQLNDRDWLIAAFDHLASMSPTVAGLFDRRHNPLWELTPSFEAATALLGFWRRRGADGEITYDFTDDSWDTRFLGDLYQDLSEDARKTYALLQTPEFVEEFILDLTLEPAIEEFGLAPAVEIHRADGSVESVPTLRTIDPACGSGHFLLGIFHRLLDKWRVAAPGVDDWELIRRSLESVHGCDKNPFAVSIARFRLLVAAMRAAGESRLDRAPGFPLNIAVGDSLLHGRGAPAVQLQAEIRDGELKEPEPHTYRTEDVKEFMDSCDLLGRSSYHVVVGNPPYITVKDKQENENYRAYSACSGKYALSVPFAQRLFRLAIRTLGSDRDAGFVGQITANSFMKREFGKKLIENFFPTVDLSHVIDTSGAYIPGHGTPTVILVGRNRTPRQSDPIRAILGIRGEPSQPEEPARGLVWSAIVDQVDKPGNESEWIGVEDAERTAFATFPWSLAGGGASTILAYLDKESRKAGDLLNRPIGFASFPGQDEAFFLSKQWFDQRAIPSVMRRALVIGEIVRDWYEHCDQDALVPYSLDQEPVPFDLATSWGRHLWSMRRVLGSTTGFGGETRADSDEPWWTWYRWVPERYRTPLSIAFAFVATHNHFVLDRGGKVFKQSAPVIKLPEGASEHDHLSLLGVLNSSTACFWLKQVSQSKGNGGIGGGISDELWEHRYEFTGYQAAGVSAA